MAPLSPMAAPSLQVVYVQVPANGCNFFPVDWQDQTNAAVWQGPAQGFWAPAPAPQVVQGMGMPDIHGMPVVHTDGGSSGLWTPLSTDCESTHSGQASLDAQEGDTRTTSRSTLRRERRRRAAKLAAAGLTANAEKPAVASPAEDVQIPPAAYPEAQHDNVAAVSPAMADEADFCARITQALEEGNTEALSAVRGSVVQLSFSALGCRLVQLALQTARGSVAAELTAELHGHVRDAVGSPHANFVLQKIIEVMPAGQAVFIAKELSGLAPIVARHSYGCRILCRLFEQCLTSQGPAALAAEILQEAGRLSWHSYGHHVIETILEHGSAEQRHQIAAALRGGDGAADNDSSSGRLLRSARNRSASHVVEKALTFCAADDRQLLVEELLSSPDAVVALAQSHFGIHVAKSLLSLPGNKPDFARQYIVQCPAEFQATKHGRRLLEELGAASPPECTVEPRFPESPTSQF